MQVPRLPDRTAEPGEGDGAHQQVGDQGGGEQALEPNQVSPEKCQRQEHRDHPAAGYDDARNGLAHAVERGVHRHHEAVGTIGNGDDPQESDLINSLSS